MVNKIMLKKFFPSVFFVLIIFLIDRLSKYWILELSKPLGELNIQITSFLNFNLIWNNGIAFGLLSLTENFYYNLVTFIIIIVTTLVTWFAFKSKGLEKISFLMIIGGALGNIFDRIYYTSVIDFIDVSYKNFHWFIFNVADIFITMGVLMLISLELLRIKK